MATVTTAIAASVRDSIGMGKTVKAIGNKESTSFPEYAFALVNFARALVTTNVSESGARQIIPSNKIGTKSLASSPDSRLTRRRYGDAAIAA